MEKKCREGKKQINLRDRLAAPAYWKPFLGITLGGIAGFLYYYFVGCTSGTCAITSNPYIRTAAGILFGFFQTNSPCNEC
jgi:hypothetical protein